MKTPIQRSAAALGLVILMAGILPDPAHAGEALRFDELWKKIQDRSPQLVAAKSQSEAARIAADRASRHWFPRLALDTRAFQTNDAGTILFSLLGQRSVTFSDLVPTTANNPGAHFLGRGSLIADLPLYEGGSRVALADASSRAADSRALESQAIARREFVETASSYASLLALSGQRAELQRIREAANELLGRYDIGSKANPVGYSGWLGLKSLQNRVEALLDGNGARQDGIRVALETRAGGLPKAWEPGKEEASAFLRKSLPDSGRSEGAQAPVHVRAAAKAAEAAEVAAGAQKALLLPRAGLFAQGDMVKGDRDVGTAYSLGAYLQWEIFSAPSYGATRQATLEAAAARGRADAELERSRAELEGSREMALSLERNLARLQDSGKLLAEQTQTAKRLYLNGSINALQLVEVFARRTDLAVDRAEAELRLAEARARLHLQSDSEFQGVMQ